MSTCPFSNHKNMFGIQGEGAHALKFHGTSILDYFMTIIGAFLITALTGWPLVLTTIGAFVAGIIMHTLFGVNTKAVNALGLTCSK